MEHELYRLIRNLRWLEDFRRTTPCYVQAALGSTQPSASSLDLVTELQFFLKMLQLAELMGRISTPIA